METKPLVVEVDFAYDAGESTKKAFWKLPHESEETDHHKAENPKAFAGEMTNYLESEGAIYKDDHTKLTVNNALERFFAMNPDRVRVSATTATGGIDLDLVSNIIDK